MLMLLLIHRNTIISLPGTGNIKFKTFLKKLVFTDRKDFRKKMRKKKNEKKNQSLYVLPAFDDNLMTRE